MEKSAEKPASQRYVVANGIRFFIAFWNMRRYFCWKEHQNFPRLLSWKSCFNISFVRISMMSSLMLSKSSIESKQIVNGFRIQLSTLRSGTLKYLAVEWILQCVKMIAHFFQKYVCYAFQCSWIFIFQKFFFQHRKICKIAASWYKEEIC